MSKQIALHILDAKGAKKGDLKVDDRIFGKSTSQGVVYDTVRYQLLKKRAGTHSVLTKGTMKGGGKKPWKQKGTGRARAGTNTSPLWVGGGVAHGPKPHKYVKRTMKRLRRQSLAAVLREKMLEGNFLCFENLGAERTSDFVSLLDKVKLGGRKVLLVAANETSSSKELRAARNIKGLKIINATAVNTYDVLNSDAVVATQASFEQLQSALSSSAKQGEKVS